MAVQPDIQQETRPRKDRRHLRTAITMLVLTGFVAVSGWYGWNSLTRPADAGDATAVAPTCVPAIPSNAPAPADIQLNVYNATDRNGLASATARELRKRGFAILDVTNDPLGKTVAGTAEVRAGAANQAAAGVVVAQVAGAVFVPDTRTDTSVDLVLGETYQALAPPGQPAPAAPPAGSTLPPC